MAAIYALPSPTVNGHGHGAHHSHSHIRKTAPQRSPLRPASMNETAYNVNALTASNNLLKPEMQHHHQPSNSADVFYDIPQEQMPSPQTFKPRPSFSTPNGARTKSMERRKSVGLPTHLRLQPNGYGFPPSALQRSRASTIEGGAAEWMTTAEALNALLIPLPYVLASLSCSQLFARGVEEGDTSQLDDVGPLAKFDGPLVCSLTALTLVLVGLRGKISTSSVSLDRRKKSLGGEEIVEKRQWARLGRRIVARVVVVGLPFYATSMLGATRVTLILLAGLASSLMVKDDDSTDLSVADWNRLFGQRQWTLGSIALQLLYDLLQISNQQSATNTCLGYLALGIALFVLPPPFPSSNPRISIVTTSPPASESSTSAVLATPWDTAPQLPNRSIQGKTISPLICTPEDVNLTLSTGTVLSILSVIVGHYLGASSRKRPMTPAEVCLGLLAAIAAALALTIGKPRSLQSHKSMGLVIGSAFSLFISIQWGSDSFSSFAFQSILVGIAFVATRLDTPAASSTSSHFQHQHQHQHQPQHHHHHAAQTQVVQFGEMSRLSAFLIQKIPHRRWGVLLIGILSEKDSRRIFYFMCLNLAFMTFQTFVGVVTGSLGLLSDSIHMFFDCVALVVGMCAAVMSKWPPSTRFPYGYGKMDSLSGFANGIFLMLISVEIIYEAIERLGEGHEVKDLGELFITSVGGLLVNIVGLTAFGHAHHGHSHGGHGAHDHSDEPCAAHQHDDGHFHYDENHSLHGSSHHNPSHHDHTHDHSHHDHSRDNSPQRYDHQARNAHTHGHLHDHVLTAPTPSPSIYSSVPATPSKPAHAHPHSHSHGHGSHSHGHSHESDNMMGIYLHIAADALGSASVIASTAAIWWSGWSGWDALASSITAVLIFGSAVPLVRTSARNLLLTVPAGTEYDLREALTGLSGLRGVANYTVPKFWLESGEGSEVLGVIHVIASKGADMEDVKERAVTFLKGRRMNVIVQVEREGNGRCWCQAGK